MLLAKYTLKACKRFNLDINHLLHVRVYIDFFLQEQSVLVQHYSVGEWNVGHCLNCSTDVYVRHKENKERLLVFSNLLVSLISVKTLYTVEWISLTDPLFVSPIVCLTL